jgi:hypothetical protein
MLSIDKKDLETILTTLKIAEHSLKQEKPSFTARMMVLEVIALIENQYLNKKPNYKS